jgi:hypothetical protein
MLLSMTREEKAFIAASIQLKSDAEKEEQSKMRSKSAKRPRKGR